MAAFVKHGILPLLLAALVVAPRNARATVVVPADLGELTRDAEAIARGRVVAVEGQWTAGRQAIETVVTLETERYLKGRFGDIVQFKVPGGTLGRFTSVVVGAPRFVVGQRVIVFLGARGPMVPFVLGFNQGVYRLVQQANGQTAVVPPPVLPSAGPMVRGSASRAPSSLEVFERDVRGLLEAGR